MLGPILFLLYVNDFQNCSKIFDFHLFADDTNLFLVHKSIATLEKETSEQLNLVHEWLCANKLSLNIDKSNFVIFHPTQKKLTYAVNIAINNKFLKYKDNIKYLGVLIDKNLNWKSHVSFLSKKIKRNIGAISKLRHFVNRDILINLYYALIYPYFTYGILAWGNTYNSTVNPLFTQQKKISCIITFSDYRGHTSPLFANLNILKVCDLVYFHNAIFMHDYHSGNLPSSFNSFFIKVNQRHSFYTRLASKMSFSLPQVWTNYGKFNIRFTGVKVWNSTDDKLKTLKKSAFKKKLKDSLIASYLTS